MRKFGVYGSGIYNSGIYSSGIYGRRGSTPPPPQGQIRYLTPKTNFTTAYIQRGLCGARVRKIF